MCVRHCAVFYSNNSLQKWTKLSTDMKHWSTRMSLDETWYIHLMCTILLYLTGLDIQKQRMIHVCVSCPKSVAFNEELQAIPIRLLSGIRVHAVHSPWSTNDYVCDSIYVYSIGVWAYSTMCQSHNMDVLYKLHYNFII